MQILGEATRGEGEVGGSQTTLACCGAGDTTRGRTEGQEGSVKHQTAGARQRFSDGCWHLPDGGWQTDRQTDRQTQTHTHTQTLSLARSLARSLSLHTKVRNSTQRARAINELSLRARTRTLKAARNANKSKKSRWRERERESVQDSPGRVALKQVTTQKNAHPRTRTHPPTHTHTHRERERERESVCKCDTQQQQAAPPSARQARAKSGIGGARESNARRLENVR